MRISGLHIDGFGLFHDLKIGQLPGGLTVFLGHNEAGKSTLVAFIIQMLFGFPDQRTKELSYPPLAGGNPGGRLTLRFEGLGTVEIERKKGPRGGRITVYLPDGRRGGAVELQSLLGSTSKELFRSIFAFSLSELQGFESLNNDAVKGAIYGASLGASLMRLPRVEKDLVGSRQGIFRPRGRVAALNRKLSEFESLRKKLKTARDAFDLFERLFSKQQELDRKIRDFKKRQDLLRTKRATFRSYMEIWEDFKKIRGLEARLKEMAPVPKEFPEDAIHRLEVLEQRLSGVKDQEARLLLNLEALKGEVENIVIDQDLIGLESPLKALIYRLAEFRQVEGELPELKSKLHGLKGEMKALLHMIGPDWTVERVSRLDRSILTRDTIMQMKRRLDDERLAVSNSGNRLDEMRAMYKQARVEEKEILARLVRSSPVDSQWDLTRIDQVEAGREHLEFLVRKIPERRKILDDVQSRLLESLREINEDWDENSLRSFDSSLSARQVADRFSRELDEKREALTALTRELDDAVTTDDRIKTAIGTLKEEIALLEARIGLPGKCRSVEEFKETVSRLKALNEELSGLSRERAFLEDRIMGRQREADALSMVLARNLAPFFKWGGLTSMFLFLLAVAAICFLPDLRTEAFSGLVAALVAWGFFHIGKRELEKAHEVRGSMEEIRTEISSLQEEIKKNQGQRDRVEGAIVDLATRIEAALPLTPEGIAGLEVRVSSAQELAGRIKSKEEVLLDHEREHDMFEQRIVAIRNKREGARKALARVEERWNVWLRKAGLMEGLAPGAMEAIFSRVESARELLRQRDELKRDLLSLMDGLREHIGLINAVFAQSFSVDSNLERLPEKVRQLLEGASLLRSEILERQELEAECLARRQRRQALFSRVQEARARLKRARDREARTISRWRQWLKGQGLSQDLLPDTALDLMGIFKDVLIKQERIDETERRISRDEEFIMAFLHDARELIERTGRRFPGRNRVPAILEEMDKALGEAKVGRARMLSLNKQIEACEKELENLKEKRISLHKEMEVLFLSGGAEDEEEFRKLAHRFNEAREIHRQRSALEVNILRVTGHSDIQGFTKALEGLNRQKVEEALDDVERGLDEITGDLDRLIQERADLKARMNELASSREISILGSSMESLKEEIRRLARDWCRYSIALELIVQTRRRIERDKQPKVIRDASRFFRRITGGRYVTIVTPIGGDSIEVVSENARRKRPQELSRGTAEQLYLSLRFGYVTNYIVNGERLPIIMDDILVNFDPSRARRTAETILEVARQHQILFFTCHPETVDIFRQVIPDLNTFVFDGRSILPG